MRESKKIAWMSAAAAICLASCSATVPTQRQARSTGEDLAVLQSSKTPGTAEGTAGGSPTTGGSAPSTGAGALGSAQPAIDGFLKATDGSAQLQSGRSILKDSVAILQADVEMQIGSSLVDDATFAGTGRSYRIQAETSTASATVEELKRKREELYAAIRVLKAKAEAGRITEGEKRELENLLAHLQATEKGLNEAQAKLSTSTGSSVGDQTTNDSTRTPPATGSIADLNLLSSDQLRKQMEELHARGTALNKKLHEGELSESERKEFDAIRRKYEELARILNARKHEELAKQQQAENGGRPPEKPPEKRPEVSKVDPQTKRPEAPKEHNNPKDLLTKVETTSAQPSGAKSHPVPVGGEELRQKLEQLQKANEALKKQLERQLDETKKLTEDFKRKLAELTKKKDEEARKHKELAKNVTKTVVDDEDAGTRTFTMKMENDKKGVHTVHEAVKVVSLLDHSVISESSLLSKTLPHGGSMEIGRSRVRSEDGGWSVRFDSVITKDGQTKKVSWNKVVNEDLSGSATGTITKPDGSTIKIEITRDPDGTTRTTGEDSRLKVKAEITKGELDRNATVKVVDTESGKALVEGAIQDTDEITPDAN